MHECIWRDGDVGLRDFTVWMKTWRCRWRPSAGGNVSRVQSQMPRCWQTQTRLQEKQVFVLPVLLTAFWVITDASAPVEQLSYFDTSTAVFVLFGILMLLTGQQEEHLMCKKTCIFACRRLYEIRVYVDKPLLKGVWSESRDLLFKLCPRPMHTILHSQYRISEYSLSMRAW